MLTQEEATRSIMGDESQGENTYRSSFSLRFSLQLCTHEGLAVKGDMSMDKTAVPSRASRPTVQDYDDDTVGMMPHSALVWRATTVPNTTATMSRTTKTVSTTTNRVSGTTRLGLYLLLVLCLAFLFNGLVMPALVSLGEQLRYGDARITTYDINTHHFIAQDDHNKLRIIITSDNGDHNQILTMVVSGIPNHSLVTLIPNGNNIDVTINGTSALRLEPDGHGGYKWGTN